MTIDCGWWQSIIVDKKLFNVEMLNGSVEDNDLVHVCKLSVNCKFPSIAD